MRPGEPHRQTVYLVGDGAATDPDPGRPAAGRLRPLSGQGVPRRRGAESRRRSSATGTTCSARPSASGRSGARRWREAPLEARGNDRFDGVVHRRTRSAAGVPRSRPGSTRTRPGSTSSTARSRPARTDLGGELAEGRALFGEGDGRGLAAAAAGLVRPRPPRAPSKSPVLGVDVDRERARFGAWYELFPRSWGGFEGVAAVLPRARGARLRRRLPAAGPSDRRDATARAGTTR